MLLLASLPLAGYLLSCAGTSSTPPPKVQKLTDAVASVVPPTPPVTAETHTAPPPPEPGKTVAEVSTRGCTTTVVKKLSEQIIAEANCLEPGAYARLPRLRNVTMSDSVFPYMAEPARDALVKTLEKSKRSRMRINSMLRTVAQQYLLYAWYKRKRCGITLAARPGKSNHQSGLAIDIRSPKSWRKRLSRAGFRWLGKRDRWHFDYVRGRKAKRLRKRKHALDIKAFQRLWNRNHADEPIDEDGDFGKSTEDALRRAPASGFPVGANCDASNDE